MKIFLVLCFCALIAKEVNSAAIDGYSYEQPAISFDYAVNTQQRISEDETVNQAQENSLDYNQQAEVYQQEEVQNVDIQQNEENLQQQQEIVPVTAANDIHVFHAVLENEAQQQYEQSSGISAAVEDSNQEEAAHSEESSVDHAVAVEDEHQVEVENQEIDHAEESNSAVEDNSQIEAQVEEVNHQEESQQQEIDHAEASNVVVEDNHQVEVQNRGSLHAEEASLVQSTVVEDNHQAVVQSEDIDHASESTRSQEAATAVEHLDTNANGYVYEQPQQGFTLPPPLEGQLAIEENFMHQDLGSVHKPRHHGHVKRIKLKGAQFGGNSLSPCENARHWQTVVAERSEKRPKDRRLAPYTEEIADEAYFQS